MFEKFIFTKKILPIKYLRILDCFNMFILTKPIDKLLPLLKKILHHFLNSKVKVNFLFLSKKIKKHNRFILKIYVIYAKLKKISISFG